MTSRQARRERRERERKAKKAAYKAGLQAALPPPAVPPPCGHDELTPEFVAYANSMRERVARRAGIHPETHGRLTTSPPEAKHHGGFVSQNAPGSEKPPVEAPTRITSGRRTEANRANAAHSTGPRTPTGKLASSRNSLKHGLASGTLLIPGEDQAAFDSLLESLLADHQPATTIEQMVIHEMAQSFWLTQRAVRLQNECFTQNGVDEKRLALFLRYQTTYERAFHKALNALIRLQKDHRRQIRDAHGFVSQQDTNSARASGFVSQTDPLLASKFHFETENEPPPPPPRPLDPTAGTRNRSLPPSAW